MVSNTIAPEELIRKAVIEVAQLPENELLLVIEMLGELKKQRTQPNRDKAVALVAQAKIRAAETNSLSRVDLMQQFGDVLKEIRAEAIAKGTALDAELEDG